MNIFLLFFMQSITQPAAPGLTITFTNIQKGEGKLLVAIYDSPQSYMKTDQVRVKRVLPVTGKDNIVLELPDLEAGMYAVSCFHDVNGNDKLDTNLVGIPNEPYGASNDARPKFRAPNWEETKFEVKSSGSAISIRLEKW